MLEVSEIELGQPWIVEMKYLVVNVSAVHFLPVNQLID